MKKYLLSLGLTALMASPALAGTVLVGSLNGNISSVDTATGVNSNTFDTGSQSWFDLAIDSGGNVYGSNGGSSLYSIDTIGHSSSFIGGHGTFVNALAFSSSDILFGAGGGSLFTINTTTGQATTVGSGIGGGYSSSGDIAFGAGGVLYGTSQGSGCNSGNDCLFSIDTTTGIGSLIGDIGYSSVYGLAYVDGTLFGMSSGNTLISLDTSTGAGTLGLSYALSGGTGGGAVIAPSAVPIPASFPLLLSVIGGLGFFGRRKKQAA